MSYCREARAWSSRASLVRAQVPGQRWTYLGSGMTHPKFVGTLTDLNPAAAARVAKVAEALS